MSNSQKNEGKRVLKPRKRFISTLTAAFFVTNSIMTSFANGQSVILNEVESTNDAVLYLHDAIWAASQNNPRLQAAREEVSIRSTDIRIAQSDYRPNVSSFAEVGFLDQTNSFSTAPDSTISGRSTVATVNFEQPIFRGFRTVNAVRQARANRSAAEASLAIVEQEVFFEVITSFLDIARDTEIIALNIENLEILMSQLEVTERRYQAAASTRTDLARSKSAVATARSNLAESEGNLAISKTILERLIGYSAENFGPLPPLPELPVSTAELLSVARANNPNIELAETNRQASTHAINEARGERLPTVNFNSSIARTTGPVNFGLFTDNRVTTSTTLGVNVTIPLYQSGREFANVRRAKQLRQQRLFELQQAELLVKADVLVSWQTLQSSRVATIANKEAVVAAEIAASGARETFEAGALSILDLIDTEQTLLNARIELAQFERESQLSAYMMLNAAGLLTAKSIQNPARFESEYSR